MGPDLLPAETIRTERTTAAPRRRRGGARAVMRIAARDIMRHRGRSALIVGLIMLPVAAVSAGATLVQSTQATPAEVVTRELGAAQARYTSGVLPGPGAQQLPADDHSIQMTGPLTPQSDWKPAPVAEALPPAGRILPDRAAQTEAWVTAASPRLGARCRCARPGVRREVPAHGRGRAIVGRRCARDTGVPRHGGRRDRGHRLDWLRGLQSHWHDRADRDVARRAGAVRRAVPSSGSGLPIVRRARRVLRRWRGTGRLGPRARAQQGRHHRAGPEPRARPAAGP